MEQTEWEYAHDTIVKCSQCGAGWNLTRLGYALRRDTSVPVSRTPESLREVKGWRYQCACGNVIRAYYDTDPSQGTIQSKIIDQPGMEGKANGWSEESRAMKNLIACFHQLILRLNPTISAEDLADETVSFNFWDANGQLLTMPALEARVTEQFSN